MPTFHPKEILREAQKAEKEGNARIASNHYATLGIYLLKRSKAKEAKVVIDRAIQLSPSSARLYIQRARCEIALERPVEARAAMDLFSHYAIERKKVEAYTPYLEAQLKEYPQLRKGFYEAVLQIDRTDSFAFLGLARAQKQCI